MVALLDGEGSARTIHDLQNPDFPENEIALGEFVLCPFELSYQDRLAERCRDAIYLDTKSQNN